MNQAVRTDGTPGYVVSEELDNMPRLLNTEQLSCGSELPRIKAVRSSYFLKNQQQQKNEIFI